MCSAAEMWTRLGDRDWASRDRNAQICSLAYMLSWLKRYSFLRVKIEGINMFVFM